MKKTSLNLILVLIIFAIFVVGILTYVSILGENHQINRIIANYLRHVKAFRQTFKRENFPVTSNV